MFVVLLFILLVLINHASKSCNNNDAMPNLKMGKSNELIK